MVSQQFFQYGLICSVETFNFPISLRVIGSRMGQLDVHLLQKLTPGMTSETLTIVTDNPARMAMSGEIFINHGVNELLSCFS